MIYTRVKLLACKVVEKAHAQRLQNITFSSPFHFCFLTLHGTKPHRSREKFTNTSLVHVIFEK